MSDKKIISIQLEEIPMEQIRTYHCLYDKSKMSYKEHGVNRNAWSKKLQKSRISFKTVYTSADMKNLLCISSGKESKS